MLKVVLLYILFWKTPLTREKNDMLIVLLKRVYLCLELWQCLGHVNNSFPPFPPFHAHLIKMKNYKYFHFSLSESV